jgi:hypothetical protein
MFSVALNPYSESTGKMFTSYSRLSLSNRRSTSNIPRVEKLRRQSLRPTILLTEDVVWYMRRIFENHMTQGALRLNHFSVLLRQNSGQCDFDWGILDEVCYELETLGNPLVSWNEVLRILRSGQTRLRLPSESTAMVVSSSSGFAGSSKVDLGLMEYHRMLTGKGILSPDTQHLTPMGIVAATPRHGESQEQEQYSADLRRRLAQLDQLYAKSQPSATSMDTASKRFDALEKAGPQARSHMIVDDDVAGRLISNRFGDIDDTEQRKAKQALNGPKTGDVLMFKYNIDITRDKFSCLRPHTWLNDEVLSPSQLLRVILLFHCVGDKFLHEHVTRTRRSVMRCESTAATFIFFQLFLYGEVDWKWYL